MNNSTTIADQVRRETGEINLRRAVEAGLKANSLRALSVAIALNFCPFCGKSSCDESC